MTDRERKIFKGLLLEADEDLAYWHQELLAGAHHAKGKIAGCLAQISELQGYLKERSGNEFD